MFDETWELDLGFGENNPSTWDHWTNIAIVWFFQIVKCVRDPSGFHSDKLHKALEEGDTKTVARIILGKNKVNQF